MAVNQYPGIPSVTNDKELAAAVRALVEAVQLLIGATGTGDARAITVQEYNALLARVEVLETP